MLKESSFVPSSVVCLSVGLSACHSSEPCKTAEPIEMPFVLRTSVSQRNHVLDGVQIPHCKEQFWRGKGRPIVNYTALCGKLYKNSWTDRGAV